MVVVDIVGVVVVVVTVVVVVVVVVDIVPARTVMGREGQPRREAGKTAD